MDALSEYMSVHYVCATLAEVKTGYQNPCSYK